MPSTLPGPYNTFVPNAKSSGNLIVDFSRSINDFALLKYVQLVVSQNTLGLYYRMGLNQRARVLDNDAAAYRWADGTRRPRPQNQAEYFSEEEFRTLQYSYYDSIGWQTKNQAAWDEQERRSRSLAQQAMTIRTNVIQQMLQTPGNWPASHVFDMSGATGIPGVTSGTRLNDGTAANPVLLKVSNHVKNLVTLDTRAAVKGNDLMWVFGPTSAQALAISQEIVELVKQNVGGLAYLNLQGDLFKRTNYNLPNALYDNSYIVEDTVRVTSERGLNITQAADYSLPVGSMMMLYRPNDLEGVEGGRSFSTATCYVYGGDEMKLETKDDSFDHLTEIAITDNFTGNMTAPITGALFLNALR